MARKKLNKKVAIIGSLMLAFFLAGVVVVFLRLTQDPDQFIKEGDIAREAKDYETAQRNYRKAFGLTKETPLRLEIAFKLADLYVEMDDWIKAAGTWNSIITLDTKNIQARQYLLDYAYESADSGQWTQWRMVESNCSDLIDLQPSAQLYLRRGRARYEIAARGQTTDREKTIADAIEDLEKTRQMEPKNSESYKYLTRAIIEKGNILSSKGLVREADKSIEEAQQLLQQAIDILPEEPELYIEQLSVKLLALEESESQEVLETEYLALVDKFETSPEVFTALSRFYQTDHTKIDKAIATIEKAVELDTENIDNILYAADLYYRRAFLKRQQADIDKAIEIAQNALDLPGTQDVSGPTRFKNKMNRLRLYLFLGNCWIQQALATGSPDEQAQKEEWLTKAGRAVHEIQQLYGTRENPNVLMWEGRLAHAKGQTADSVKQMYTAYEQLKPQLDGKGSNIYFAHLCYTLAGVFRNTSEIGACAQFLRTAIEHGLTQFRPDVLLDYAAVMINMNIENEAIRVIEFYEGNFSASEVSNLLYVQACNKAGLFDRAEERLSQMDPDKPDTISLKMSMVWSKLTRHSAALKSKEIGKFMSLEEQESAENLERYRLSQTRAEKLANEGIEQIETLLRIDPNYVNSSMLITVCSYYIGQNNLEYAKKLAETFHKHFPDNTTILIYKAQLYEPEPNNISPERRDEIIEQVLSTTGDELRRCLNLGGFYKDSNRPDEAVVQYNKALAIDPCNPQAISGLFDIAIGSGDFETAGKFVQTARRINLDGCEGQYFAGRLAFARDQFQDAVAKFSAALKQRPVFSQAYLYRSIAHSSLGNHQEALTDARKAAEFNPMDGNIARRFAGILYQSNQQLGSDVSPEQFEETQSALLRAAALNLGDSRLVGLYATYISDKDPLRALAYRQRLQKITPSVRNAVQLANLATEIAMDVVDTERKQALLDIASSAFEQARSMAPDSKSVLGSYAEFYRRIGKPEKAEQLLAKVQDKSLMWKNYMKTGQFEKAGEILQELYRTESSDIDTLKGLFVLSERTGDKEGVVRYSDELLAVEPTPENQLYQIQAMLHFGILSEAEKKLESFSEKYPTNDWAIQLQALLALQNGQFSRALELTNKALEMRPDNEKAWYLRGRLHHLTGDYTQAIRDLQKSKALKDNPEVRIQLAKTCLRLGRSDDAITELNNALNAENATVEARRILEQVYLSLGRRQDLLKFYADTLKKYPDDVFWYNQAAGFMVGMRNFEQAAQLFLKAWQNSQKYGGNLISFDGYLEALKSTNDYDRLLRYARRYTEGETAPIAFSRMADIKARMGDKVTAGQYYQKALERAGTSNVLALAILRSMYSELGRSGTEAWCQEQLQANANSFVANLAMFNMSYISGEYNKAIGYIDKCLQILEDGDPKRVSFVTQKVNCMQKAYARTSDNQYFTAAVDEYRKLLEKTPNNISVLNNLAYMLVDNNKEIDKALEYAQLAHDLAPGNADIMDTYAFVLYKNGKYKKATEVQRSAVQVLEQGQAAAPAEVYYHLGMIVEKMSETTEALAAYKQALELGQDKLPPKDKQLIEEAIERLSVQQESDTNTK